MLAYFILQNQMVILVEFSWNRVAWIHCINRCPHLWSIRLYRLVPHPCRQWWIWFISIVASSAHSHSTGWQWQTGAEQRREWKWGDCSCHRPVPSSAFLIRGSLTWNSRCALLPIFYTARIGCNGNDRDLKWIVRSLYPTFSHISLHLFHVIS